MALTEQRKAYLAKWRKKNRASVLASSRKYNAKTDTAAKKRAYYQANKEQWMEATRARRQRNPEARRGESARWRARYPDKARNKHLREKYGIGYDALLSAQNGVCAVCHCPPKGSSKTKHLDVDHNHATGKVRGLLCRRCNALVGYIETCGSALCTNAQIYVSLHAEIPVGVSE